MILLVGATSRLGRALAELLLEAGVPFRAACRDPAKATWLAEQGVEIVPADLASGAGIEAAVGGATRVITCVHGLLGRSRDAVQQVDIDGHRRLIDAASRVGVGRFVYVSALGASLNHPSDFWRAKAQIEQHLQSSGLEYVILRPSAFMDLYAHDLIGASVLRGRTVFLLGSGTTPRNMIAVADVARAAFEALSRNDLAAQTIEVGGWDNPTEREVATLYAGLSGRPLKLRSVPFWLLRILATTVRPFHAGVGRLLSLPGQLAGREDLRLDASGIGRLGTDPVRLREFARSRIAESEGEKGS